jgi:hypothetical protein
MPDLPPTIPDQDSGANSSEALGRNTTKLLAGDAAIPVIAGDMATARAPGEYTLVYLVYNAISCLLTQAGQVACFRNAARHLTPGGRFVIELWVPELRKLPPGQQAVAWQSGPGYIGLDTYDVLRQHAGGRHRARTARRHLRSAVSGRPVIRDATARAQ